MLATVVSLLSKGMIVAGGLWAGWGGIQIAQGISDSSGPQMKSGIMQAVGGAIVIAIAAAIAALPTAI